MERNKDFLKLSRYMVKVPDYRTRSGSLGVLLFSTRSGEALVVPVKTWEQVEAGRYSQLSPRDLDSLIETEILVPSEDDELSHILEENAIAIQSDQTLYTVVQPTANCQLGCHYCGQIHEKKTMGEESYYAIIERLGSLLAAPKTNYQRLQVCWFGAEPLLGLKTILEATPELKALASCYGCSYEARLVTNGLALSKRVAENLVFECAVRHIEITIDGDAPAHNIRRMTKNGRATFDRIFANLCDVCEIDDDFDISVRCNVDRYNYEYVDPLINRMHSAGLEKRVRFYVAPVHSWGNDAQKHSFGLDEFAEMEVEWLKKLVYLGFSCGTVPSRRKIVCLAVRSDAEVADAYGGRYKCTEVSYVPLYGQPNIYDISEGASEATLRLARFNDDLARGLYPCSSCKILPICGGSCPKQWTEGHTPCPSYKLNIQERLRLAAP